MRTSWQLMTLSGAAVLAGATPSFAQDADGDGVPDAADAFPCDASRASVTYFPGQGSSALFAFEDQWPAATDLDFNDVVVRGHYRIERDAAGRVVSLHGIFDPVALGGELSNGLALQLPVSRAGVSARRRIEGGAWQTLVPEADAQATLVLSPNLRELFGGSLGRINSLAGQARVEGQRLELEVVFATPASMSVAEAPFDVFVFRSGDLSHQIHFPQYPGTAAMNAGLFGTGEDGSTGSRRFVHHSGVPAALNLMTTTRYPLEAVQISALFPDIVGFASSGGAQNTGFYSTNVVASQGHQVSARALPAEVVDRSCVPLGQSPQQAASSCRAILQNGVTTSGVYWIDPDGPGSVAAFQAYCDMTTDGGGWMVVWKNQGGAVGAALSNAQLLEGNPGSYAGVIAPHTLERQSGVNAAAWAWARGRGGLEWLKAATLYNASGVAVHQQTFRVALGAVTWNWILGLASSQACHVAPNPISVVLNGNIDLGQTNRVNSYQTSRDTFGLANNGHGAEDNCGQPNSNLIVDPGQAIYRIDGGNGLNAIRHLFSYVHRSAGRDASRCLYACWDAGSIGGHSDAFTWMVR